ncbi:hypothetical protein [Xanthomonas sacchari]|nr:hypothetical protein [Xanthomonas sacchari]
MRLRDHAQPPPGAFGAPGFASAACGARFPDLPAGRKPAFSHLS